MLSLLAQASGSLIDSDGAKIAFGAFVIAGIAYGLSILRGLRKDVAGEVRMQIREDDAESDERRVPNPLTVKAHIDFTPYHEHKELKSEFEKLRDQRSKDVHGLHQKIEQGLAKTSDSIAPIAIKVAQLQASQENQNRELSAIRSEQGEVSKRIDAMPARLVQTLKDTKGLL